MHENYNTKPVKETTKRVNVKSFEVEPTRGRSMQFKNLENKTHMKCARWCDAKLPNCALLQKRYEVYSLKLYPDTLCCVREARPSTFKTGAQNASVYCQHLNERNTKIVKNV